MIRHRRHDHPSSDNGAAPRSNVHVLESEEELQEALRRSAQFDRAISDKLRDRALRYEAMIAPTSITHIGIDRDSRSKGGSTDHQLADEPHTA
jgi:hypothetical protein